MSTILNRYFAFLFIISCFTNYGQQIPITYQSADSIDVSLQCRVMKNSNKFSYKYEVKNFETSVQNIGEFYIEYKSKSVEINSPEGWIGDTSNVRKRVVMWGSNNLVYDILPGYFLIGFEINSTNIPSIQITYLRGITELPVASEGNAPDFSEISNNDIFDNSLKVYSLAPGELHTPLIINEFLDTLINYNTNSYLLKWIKNEPTHNKYNTYLTNAKTALEQNNNNTARENLQNILTDVEIDSSSTLTSEAYALLKFNVEYLLTQIPEEEIDTMLNNLIERTEESYENGWIDNQGIYNSLRKKAENAKKEYEKGNEESTKHELESYQNELKAQKGKHVTEEGYAYMFNYAETIIEKLK